jgi:hypothetical protein
LAALTYAANHCVDLLQLLPSQSRPPVFLFADNLYNTDPRSSAGAGRSDPALVLTNQFSSASRKSFFGVGSYKKGEIPRKWKRRKCSNFLTIYNGPKFK